MGRKKDSGDVTGKKTNTMRQILREIRATGLRRGFKDSRDFYAGRNAPEGSPEREAWRKWRDEVAVAKSVPPPTKSELASQIVGALTTPKPPKVPSDLLNMALNRAAETGLPQYIFYDTKRGGFIRPRSQPRFPDEGMNADGNLILRGTVDGLGNYRSWYPGEAHPKIESDEGV